MCVDQVEFMALMELNQLAPEEDVREETPQTVEQLPRGGSIA